MSHITGLTADQVEACAMYVQPTGCLLWKGGCWRGPYGGLRINRRMYSAHRLIWELRRGAIPDEMEVCHKCDFPSCINIEHLFIATHAQNMADKISKNRNNSPRGEYHFAAKLTEANVREIRRLRKNGDHYKEIAKQFGIGWQLVYKIASGSAWKHVH